MTTGLRNENNLSVLRSLAQHQPITTHLLRPLAEKSVQHRVSRILDNLARTGVVGYYFEPGSKERVYGITQKGVRDYHAATGSTVQACAKLVGARPALASLRLIPMQQPTGGSELNPRPSQRPGSLDAFAMPSLMPGGQRVYLRQCYGQQTHQPQRAAHA